MIDGTGAPAPSLPWWAIRAAVLVALLVGAAIAYWQLGDLIHLDRLARREAELRSLRDEQPLMTAAGALALYIVVAAIIPGAMFMTLAYGWYFGFWTALLIVSFGSTAGATLAFLASRYFLGDVLSNRLGGRPRRIRDEFEKDGAYYLFSLRLMPAVPFFALNLAMGLTRIRTWTFWWVSQLGMLPGTAAYIYAGTCLPSLRTLEEEGMRGLVHWRILLALAIVGLTPLAVKKLWETLGRRSS